ncbi:MAG: hypothetical protein K6L81_01980 [Agarilytica sp.]
MPFISVSTQAPNSIVAPGVHSYGSWSVPLLDQNGLRTVSGGGQTPFLDRYIASQEPRNVLGVHRSTTHFENFYFRVHVEPREIDFGNLLSTEQRTVSIWNAHLTPVQISSFSAPQQAGVVVVSNPIGVYPYTLGLLDQIDTVFEITREGPPVISSDAIWVIQGEPVAVRFSGLRVVVITLKPNSGSKHALTERLEWKTEISTSFNGNESRNALRTKPRLGQSFKTIVEAKELRNFRSVLWGWQNKWFGVPAWMHRVVLPNGYTAGDTVLNFDPDLFSFYPEGSLILIGNDGAFESAKIDSVQAGTGVTLSIPLQNDWPENTSLYPQYIGRLPQKVSQRSITDGLVEFLLDFSFDSHAQAAFNESLNFETYLGSDVIATQPNWASPIEGDHDFDFSVFGDTGSHEIVERAESPRIYRDYSWLFCDRISARQFHSFLGRVRGRRGVFWVPTWESDFELVETVGASSTSLTVKDNGYARFVDLDSARRHIFIQLADRTHLMRQIDSAAINMEGDILLNINESLGQVVAVSDVLRISYMDRTRFASDRIEIGYFNSSTSEVRARIVEVAE